MSEWWTYRPSDFLLFAPRTYYRLIEVYNVEVWPAQLVALALLLWLVAAAWRDAPYARRAIGLVLASAWAFVGWRFHWIHYATINWAAVWFAAASGLQCVLLAAATLRGRLDGAPAAATRRAIALTVLALAIVAHPLAALAVGRPWTQLEFFGTSPDPTALATLAALLAVRHAPWWLYPVPLLWCAVSSLTLSTMQAADAVLPALGALVALVAAVASRAGHRRAR